MKSVKIALNFKFLNAALAAVFGQSILTAMTNNVNFTNPFIPLSALQVAITALIHAIAAQHPGDKASTSAVKAAKYELNRVLKPLAAYVEYISNTDETVALGSGFSLKRIKFPQLHAFIAVQGLQSGSVDVNSPTGGNSYIWEYTPEPIVEANWSVAAITTQANFTINGLNPGIKYWFRVALITSKGQQPWSNPVIVHVV